MDPNTALETTKEGAKALTKLGEITEKMMGPRWTKKQADADMYANEKKLQIIRDNPDMEIIFVNGEMNVKKRGFTDFEKHAIRRELTEILRQEYNLSKVFDVAEQELISDNIYVESDVDDDWIVRLINIAKDVSNTDMQLIWGKILAGEIKQPGSFSLRTLETIRNISQKEAEIFQKVLPIISSINLNDSFITSDIDILKENNITFNDILSLEEAGLFNSNELVTTIKIIDIPRIIIYNKEYIVMANPINGYKGECKIYEYSLTKTGCELYNLLATDCSLDYLKSISRKISKEYEGKITITIHRINNIIGNNINYEIGPIEEFK